MGLFSRPWYQEIAEVTGSPEFQDIEITLSSATEWDPALYDVVTGVDGNQESTVIYDGQARLVTTRWGTDRGGEGQANALTEKPVRIQMPHGAVGRVDKGTVVRVTSAPANPALETYVFRVTTGIQGGAAATRTIECMIDGDSVA